MDWRILLRFGRFSRRFGRVTVGILSLKVGIVGILGRNCGANPGTGLPVCLSICPLDGLPVCLSTCPLDGLTDCLSTCPLDGLVSLRSTGLLLGGLLSTGPLDFLS